MKTLNVPLILQPEGSIDCIPTCILMALKYFGQDETLENLKHKLFYNEIGTTIFDNAVLLLERGFKVKIICGQPRLFPPDLDLNTNDSTKLIEYIRKIQTKVDNNQKLILDTFIKFINKGGELIIEIPAIENIKDAIDNNMPVIGLGFAQAIGKNEGEYHSVIVTGYDENNITINNPWPLSRKQYSIPKGRFLYFIHSSTCVDMDNGTLMIISK